MTPNQIAALRRISGTMLAATSARLAALRMREEEVLTRISILDAALRDRAALASAEDPTLRAGVDLRWQIWVEQNRSTLLAAQARLRAAMEEERMALRRDFGRDHVLKVLETEAIRRTRRLALRRAWHGGDVQAS